MQARRDDGGAAVRAMNAQERAHSWLTHGCGWGLAACLLVLVLRVTVLTFMLQEWAHLIELASPGKLHSSCNVEGAGGWYALRQSLYVTSR